MYGEKMKSKKIIIKIGETMAEDLRNLAKRPPELRGATTIYLNTWDDLQELLSTKRLELLMKLLENDGKKISVSKLAKELKRKQAAISRDLTILQFHQLISKTKDKQTTYPKIEFEQIVIDLNQHAKKELALAMQK